MKIVKENIENLEITDNTVVVPQPTGAAEEESKTLWDRFMDATKVPEDAPLFGAKDQPVPKKIEEPKITLDESLFENKRLNESIIPFNQLNWEFQDGNDEEDYKEAANKVFNELKKAINNLALIPNGEGWLVDEFNVWDEFVEQTATKIMNAINAHYFENHPDSYGAGEDILVESLNEDDDFEGFDIDTPDDNPEITDEMLQEVIDEVKETVEEAEFTPEEVIEKVFDCIEDEECKYELAADVVKSTEEEMAEEDLTEDLVYGEATLDDYLDVIKKYYKNHTASEVIDSLFLNNPCMDEQTAFDVASTLGEMIEAMGAEELDW